MNYPHNKPLTLSRRSFIQSGLASAGVLMAGPAIVPSSVLGQNAPSNRINIGMIGTGRQAINANLNNGFLKLPNCQVVALNDVDSWRLALAEKTVNEAYAKKKADYKGVKCYSDYRDLIKDANVDAVMISTTDHWHAPATIAAALAGKHVCMEKAFTVAPMHGKAVVEAVKAKGVANRLDSEFRSNRQFSRAVELVHNGLIGKLTEVIVGVPQEMNGSAPGPQATTPIPAELNYDMWLGPAFPAPYTLQRVHEPKNINSRPGWLRNKDYCNGMITNWGAHLHDIASWGMKKERELPVSAEGSGGFDKGLWNTLSSMSVKYHYADGLVLNYQIDKPYVRFIGDKGWIQVVYPDDLTASDESILKFNPAAGDVSYTETLTDKADFIRAIETGKPSLEPLEVGYNVYFLCYMGLVSVELGQKITWDAQAEKFVNDNAANAMLTRPFREKWLDRNVIEWMNKYQNIYF